MNGRKKGVFTQTEGLHAAFQGRRCRPRLAVATFDPGLGCMGCAARAPAHSIPSPGWFRASPVLAWFCGSDLRSSGPGCWSAGRYPRDLAGLVAGAGLQLARLSCDRSLQGLSREPLCGPLTGERYSGYGN